MGHRNAERWIEEGHKLLTPGRDMDLEETRQIFELSHRDWSHSFHNAFLFGIAVGARIEKAKKTTNR